ncbi:hypothetical protein [Anaerobiospirillum succiniciproducens]|uniref:hypothetical protein n=1 Tax=Anaerobiospirillum succiniciproducens TaxID=13335 RepID=UPI00248DE575|nr:hypothetical protein [Anaerobiospirillum succiniciproducens]
MRLLVMVLALSGLIMVGCSGPKQKPEDVALAFNEAVFAGDVQKIMSIMYTDEDYVAIHGNSTINANSTENESGALSEGKLTIALKPVAVHAALHDGYKSAKVLAVEGDCYSHKDECSVKLEISFVNGTVHENDINLINVNGNLKVKM